MHLAFFLGGSEAVSLVCSTVFGLSLHLLLLVAFLIGGDRVFSCVTCWNSSLD